MRYVDLLKVQVLSLKTLVEDKEGRPDVLGKRFGCHHKTEGLLVCIYVRNIGHDLQSLGHLRLGYRELELWELVLFHQVLEGLR